MKKFAWIFILMLVVFSLFSQNRNTPEQYIELYHQIAIRKMVEYKIPASITLAQGILESGSGNSNLATKANNHFGIKCHTGWEGDTYIMDDDEKNECFRKYKKAEESFDDHSIFLTTRPRYKFLFDDYETTDYKGWAHGLKKAGYATNPNYANLLITLIERHDLSRFDKMTPTKPTKPTKPVVETKPEVVDLSLPKGAYYSDQAKGIYIYNRIKTVQSKGRQVIDVAVEYDVTLKKLMKYNELEEGDTFDNTQKVFLQPKRKKAAEKEHIVIESETLWEISQKYGIKLSSIRKLNLLSDDEEVAKGEVIYLRKKRTSRPQTLRYSDILPEKKAPTEVPIQNKVEISTIPNSPTNIFENEPESETLPEDEKPKKPLVEIPATHTVLPSETLYFISNKYNVTIETLMELNNLKNYNLSVGQVLKLKAD
jgi:LysM repeat protein